MIQIQIHVASLYPYQAPIAQRYYAQALLCVHPLTIILLEAILTGILQQLFQTGICLSRIVLKLIE